MGSEMCIRDSYKRYFISNENAANKWRCGFFIANYFILGRVTAELDWGFYLYDGIRNANPNPHPKYGYERPMFYTYKINDEDGWNYFRLAFKVRVWEGLTCLLYTSPSPRDRTRSRMPSSA